MEHAKDFTTDARDILFHYEPYRSMSPHEIGHRVDIPCFEGNALHYGLPGGEVFFTWMRPEGSSLKRIMRGSCPKPGDWYDEGPFLWIVDLAATPGVKGVAVGRFLSWVLAEENIAEIGETVVFRRSTGARRGYFGKAIVRG